MMKYKKRFDQLKEVFDFYADQFERIVKVLFDQKESNKEVSVMETKQCIKCEKVKPLDQFKLDKRSKDGHKKVCKDCQWKQDVYDMSYGEDPPNFKN